MAKREPKTAGEAQPRRAPARKRVSARKASATYEMVAERAYYLHLETGRDAFANWLQAERELAAV
jgi:hypothetical protein